MCVINHAGHKLPTGCPEGQRAWLSLRAYGTAGGLVCKSGDYDGATYADGHHWDDTLYVLPAGTSLVFVALCYHTASREYIEFLRANGGVDGEALRMVSADSGQAKWVAGLHDQAHEGDPWWFGAQRTRAKPHTYSRGRQRGPMAF